MTNQSKRTESELRLHRACFACGSPVIPQLEENLVNSKLMEAIQQSIDEGYMTFITGMNPGPDLQAAKLIIHLRRWGVKDMKKLKLVAAITHEGMPNRYARRFRDVYDDILRQADYVKIMADEYRDGLREERDRWMVDQCSRVISIGDDEKIKDLEMIRYAEGKGVQVFRRKDILTAEERAWKWKSPPVNPVR